MGPDVAIPMQLETESGCSDPLGVWKGFLQVSRIAGARTNGDPPYLNLVRDQAEC